MKDKLGEGPNETFLEAGAKEPKRSSFPLVLLRKNFIFPKWLPWPPQSRGNLIPQQPGSASSPHFLLSPTAGERPGWVHTPGFAAPRGSHTFTPCGRVATSLHAAGESEKPVSNSRFPRSVEDFGFSGHCRGIFSDIWIALQSQ